MANRQACGVWKLIASRSRFVPRPKQPLTGSLALNVSPLLRYLHRNYSSSVSVNRKSYTSIHQTESRIQVIPPPFAIRNSRDTTVADDSRIMKIATKRIPENNDKYTSTKHEDARAQAKLVSLTQAKNRITFLQSSYHEETEELQEAQKSLSRAYSQTIKYLGRSRLPDSALHAHRLLYESLSHFCGIPTPAMERIDMTDTEKGQLVGKILTNRNSNDKPLLMPTMKDYHNVFHSWASSKARKKGLCAEALLLQIIDWHLDGKTSGPDSKCFALTVKAIHGSTHNQSFSKISYLHDLHDAYLKRGTVGFVRDDPFFLMHSLKSVSHYDHVRERKAVEKWLESLHSFVTNPVNVSYVHGGFDRKDTRVRDDGDDSFNVVENGEGTHIGSGTSLIDLTGTYTTVIREYTRLGSKSGIAAKARHVLGLMHEIAAIRDKATEESVNMAIATVDIKVNAYNLVLGAYSNSKDEKNTTLALELLERMLDSWREKNKAAPFPNEQSFVHCIQALFHLNDVAFAHEESHRLLKKLKDVYGENTVFDAHSKSVPTTAPYNSSIQLYTSDLCMSNRSSPELLSMCLKLIDTMKEAASEFPNMTPDATTWAYMLKAYAYSNDDRDKALEKATQIFTQLEKEEKLFPNEAAKKMTDKSYLYMMKCVANLMEDQTEEKNGRIAQLFADACEKGFVSANVLKVFKSQVSDEVYINKVGSGRLADKWVANVTSAKVLYTDGTMGGEGKNARRKGKSTSDWLIKQRKRDEKIEVRNEAKLKRRIKKKSEKSLSSKTRNQVKSTS